MAESDRNPQPGPAVLDELPPIIPDDQVGWDVDGRPYDINNPGRAFMTDPLGPGKFVARGNPLVIQRVMAMLVEADPRGLYTVFMPVQPTT